MKNVFLLFTVTIFLMTQSMAQDEDIPNSGFEEWADGEPVDWNTLDGNILGTEFEMVTEENDDPYAGNASARLETISEFIFLYGEVEMPGLITLGELEVDPINQDGDVFGGVPYTGNPESLSGYFKYFPAEGDTAALGAVLYKWTGETRDTLAGGEFTVWEEVAEWTEFEAVMEYVIWEEPDTMNIIASSTAVEGEEVPVGSVLLLDQFTFNYGPASIINPGYEDGFRVYPEMYHNKFKIELELDKPERATIQMYNISGNRIMQKQKTLFHGITYVSYRDVPAGIYIIRVMLESGKVYTQKVQLH